MFLADSQIIATWVDIVEIQYGSAFVLSAFSRQTEMFRKRAREYLIGRNMAHSCYIHTVHSAVIRKTYQTTSRM